MNFNSLLVQFITASGNTAVIMIILYWLVDTIKNWKGTPELKLLKGQLEDTNAQFYKLNNHIATLIEKL